MGSYAECWLDSLNIGSTKYDFDSELMQLFRASDKGVQRCALKELPHPLRSWGTEDLEKKVVVVYYIAPALLVKGRLELKGYTLDTSKRAFIKQIRAESKQYARWAEENEFSEDLKATMTNHYKSTAKLLKELDVSEWISTLRHIKEAGLESVEQPSFSENEDIQSFMLQHDWYGFSGANLNIPLRLAIEACTERDNFIYDLSDLVDSGYFRKGDDFVALASETTAENIPRAQR